MEPDSLSAESAFPPPPPLLPPPVPPPVASPSASASLWRWNDRLALVVGGLTLFLLGIVAGRVFGPDTASKSIGGDRVAAVGVASQSTEKAGVISTDAETIAEEINPPELIESPEPVEPIAIPEGFTAEASTVVAPKPPPTASTPLPSEIAAAASADTSETEVTSTTVAPVAPQASPVSLEGKVPTIKPPAATQVCEPAEKFKNRKLSTALTWAESVEEAAQQAEQDEKLVFLIHVSGNFEMPGFT